MRSAIKALYIFCIALLMSWSTGEKHKTYYFSNSGNDTNTGLAENDPWKSLSKIDSLILNPGDKILLNRGDAFHGSIFIRHSGTNQHPITIAAYGDGGNPKLKGSFLVSDYESQEDGLISFRSEQPIKNILINDEFLIPARYPNSGYLRIDKKENAIGILQDKDLELDEDGYWDDARLVFRSTDWTYDWETINKFRNNTFYYDTLDLKYPVRENYGYFLDNKAELLDTAGEYYYNAKDKTCKLFPVDTDVSAINAVIFDYGIYLADSVNNINIQNIEFNQYHKAGVYGKSNNENISISECKLLNIDEAGVRFANKALSCKVENSSFYNIMGRGISFTNSRKCTISDNVVKNIGLIPGLGLHGVNGMTGILVEARDERRNRIFDIEHFQSDSNYVGLNRVDSCGYIGIRVDGQHNMVEKNFINYAMLQLSDGGALYCYIHTSNSTFRNNFVFNSVGNNESTAKTHHLIALGIYMDGSTDCRIYNNTVYNNTEGIVLNSNSKNHELVGNVLYGNTRNQLSLPTQKEVFDENYTIKGNTFFCTDSTQFCIIQMFKTVDTSFGTFANNIYCDPYSEYIVKRIWNIEDSLTLQDWQQIGGEDINSTTCEFYDPQKLEHKLFYNLSNNDTTIHLHTPHLDLNGNELTQLELSPFTSDILFFKKE